MDKLDNNILTLGLPKTIFLLTKISMPEDSEKQLESFPLSKKETTTSVNTLVGVSLQGHQHICKKEDEEILVIQNKIFSYLGLHEIVNQG